ncbi:YbjN domain-containing protein [Fuerstiella marisgermanici]|uniref:YbjN domain-containing protein n=1 Tax=Fuerstiella marisgermanici TaxID=1891926 RepID=A0A1P8WGS2_9PLAN|nr:YbjN domain-containing protein [Fuerstiella marisgermanici]APZ93242.1 hypothetical protein Fuma_02859 [Fuerstiella marisgermanici]
MSTNMNQLLDYLQREELNVADHNEEHAFLRFDGDSGDQKLVLSVDEGRLLQSFVYPAFRVPEGSRPDIAIAVSRANYGLKVGKFELDMNDGELRYQAALLFDGDLPADKVMDRVVYVGLSMMDRYMPAFMSVIYGNEPARDAVALVEQI